MVRRIVVSLFLLERIAAALAVIMHYTMGEKTGGYRYTWGLVVA